MSLLIFLKNRFVKTRIIGGHGNSWGYGGMEIKVAPFGLAMVRAESDWMRGLRIAIFKSDQKERRKNPKASRHYPFFKAHVFGDIWIVESRFLNPPRKDGWRKVEYIGGPERIWTVYENLEAFKNQ